MEKEGQNIKIVFVGDGGVGKTCCQVRMCNNSFPLWDTAGQEDYDRLRPLSYPETHIFVICFSLVDPISLENVVSKWYPEITEHEENATICLLGTKKDLRNDEIYKEEIRNTGSSSEPVTTEKGEKVAKKIKACYYCEVSAKTCEIAELTQNLREILDAAFFNTRKKNSINAFFSGLKFKFKKFRVNGKSKRTSGRADQSGVVCENEIVKILRNISEDCCDKKYLDEIESYEERERTKQVGFQLKEIWESELKNYDDVMTFLKHLEKLIKSKKKINKKFPVKSLVKFRKSLLMVGDVHASFLKDCLCKGTRFFCIKWQHATVEKIMDFFLGEWFAVYKKYRVQMEPILENLEYLDNTTALRKIFALNSCTKLSAFFRRMIVERIQKINRYGMFWKAMLKHVIDPRLQDKIMKADIITYELNKDLNSLFVVDSNNGNVTPDGDVEICSNEKEEEFDYFEYLLQEYGIGVSKFPSTVVSSGGTFHLLNQVGFGDPQQRYDLIWVKSCLIIGNKTTRDASLFEICQMRPQVVIKMMFDENQIIVKVKRELHVKFETFSFVYSEVLHQFFRNISIFSMPLDNVCCDYQPVCKVCSNFALFYEIKEKEIENKKAELESREKKLLELEKVVFANIAEQIQRRSDCFEQQEIEHNNNLNTKFELEIRRKEIELGKREEEVSQRENTCAKKEEDAKYWEEETLRRSNENEERRKELEKREIECKKKEEYTEMKKNLQIKQTEELLRTARSRDEKSQKREEEQEKRDKQFKEREAEFARKEYVLQQQRKQFSNFTRTFELKGNNMTNSKGN